MSLDNSLDISSNPPGAFIKPCLTGPNSGTTLLRPQSGTTLLRPQSGTTLLRPNSGVAGANTILNSRFGFAGSRNDDADEWYSKIADFSKDIGEGEEEAIDWDNLN